MGKSKSMLNAILWVLLIAFLAVAVAFIVSYYGGFQTTVDKIKDSFNQTFTVKYDGKTYTVDNDELLILPLEGKARFDITGVNEYSVKVEPNTDFEYTVNGRNYRFGDTEYSSQFLSNGNILSDSFVIDCDKDYSIDSVLASLRGVSVDLPQNVCRLAFKLVITSNVDIIEIPFAQSSKATNLALSTPTIEL